MKIFDMGDDTFAIILEKGEKIIQALKRISSERNLFGYFSGIGAVDWVKIGFGDVSTGKCIVKEYEGDFEILSLVGNISKNVQGEVVVHAHILIGDKDFNVLGGHLFEGKISITAEIFFKRTKGKLLRKRLGGTEFQLVEGAERE